MRVAFASSDGRFVDQRFGEARRFAIWEVSAESATSVEIVVPGGWSSRHDRQLDARVAVLDGCALVYAAQIGNPAACVDMEMKRWRRRAATAP